MSNTSLPAGWKPCACGAANCDTFDRECVHGRIAILPRSKGLGGFDVMAKTPLGYDDSYAPSLSNALSIAENFAQRLGGWMYPTEVA